MNEHIEKIRDKCKIGITKNFLEENTKMFIINPLLSYLGYDITDDEEVNFEVNAIVDGTIKNEKIDVAVYLNGLSKPKFILEAKSINTKLDKKYRNQLYRYFTTLNPEFAILTNGREWWFYTDLDKQNLMDDEPYLKIDILNDDDLNLLYFYSKENIINKDIKSMIVSNRLDKFVDDFINNLSNGKLSNSLLNVLKMDYNLSNYSISDNQIKNILSNRITNVLQEAMKEDSQKLNISLYHRTFKDSSYNGNLIKSFTLFNKKTNCKSLNFTELFRKFIISLVESNMISLDDLLNYPNWSNHIKVFKGIHCDGLKTYQRSSLLYIEKYDISIISHSDTNDKLKVMIEVLDYFKFPMDSVIFELKKCGEKDESVNENS